MINLDAPARTNYNIQLEIAAPSLITMTVTGRSVTIEPVRSSISETATQAYKVTGTFQSFPGDSQ